MSLILCRQEPVTSPYFVEELGVHLYSSQELNYVIYHHPLLVMEDFVNERLAAFLRTELRLPFLAERIQKWIQSRGPSDELLFLILQDCAFYTQAEQAAYRQKVAGLRKLSSHEYEKRRADYFYSLGLYGRSASMYKRILDNGDGRSLSHEFRGKVWNNLGACYGELFSFQKAMDAYVCAWNEKPEAAYLKGMYFLTKLDPELSMKDGAGSFWLPRIQRAGTGSLTRLWPGPDRRDLRYGSRKFSTGIRKKGWREPQRY